MMHKGYIRLYIFFRVLERFFNLGFIIIIHSLCCIYARARKY